MREALPAAWRDRIFNSWRPICRSDDVIHFEKTWKNRIGTRELGLNKN